MHLVAILLSLLVAAEISVPDDPPETPVPHHREGDWMRLGHSTPTRLGSEVFAVGTDAGWISVVRIERVWGTVELKQVVIVRGHSSETFNVHTRLDHRRPSTYIDLGRPRTIDEIIVHTEPSQHGAYAIYGSAAAPRPEVAKPKAVARTTRSASGHPGT
jgi:hypothetical protein